ncbi:MAG: 50S ribosomal protein L11 methyltransferase [Solirubrobacterales bacterium]
MIRLAIRCRAEHADLALAQLIELAPTGIEEVRDGDIVEYAVYGPPGEIPSLPDLQVAVGDDLVEVTTSEVADDWQERWRDFHHALKVSPASGVGERTFFLRPSWESVDAPEGSVEVVLDPGQAFGTGSHPTTRLCVAHLLDLEPGGEFVDIGCGSGVLAIAAGKLGWGPLRGYDFDPLAVTATIENAEANGVAIEVSELDVREEAGGLPPLAPTVFANIMRPQLLDVARQLPDDHGIREIVLSGLLDEEADEIAAAYAARGLDEVGRISEGGWTALRLSAP